MGTELNKRQEFFKLAKLSILAAILIALGGTAYLRISDKIIGSAMFSIGLYAVIELKANLFTGKVGYINNKKKLIDGAFILLFNIFIALICGIIYRYNFGIASSVATKLDKNIFKLFVDSVICGICIYLAVEGGKTNKVMVLLGVMVFILVGAEHCVADAFYLGASETITWINMSRLLIVILGNSVGSLLIRILQVEFNIKKEIK